MSFFHKHKRAAAFFAVFLLITVVLMSSCSKKQYEHTPGQELAQTPFSAAGSRRAAANDLALAFNAVYRNFGTDETTSLVYRFGNEPTYYEWMALRAAWTDDTQFIGELKNKIVSFPQTDNGYLWSWGTSVYWPTGKGDMHYDGLFRYVSAVAELLRWEGEPSFLDEVDGDTFGGDDAVDASRGRTVYQKCRLAMDYAITALHGQDGLITLTLDAVYLADGKTRFDKNADGEVLWDNTGRAGAQPSNYWDNLCFGHQDAYETALFYHALLDMRDIETLRGDGARARACGDLAQTVKQRFNETFWDETKGRYIACVDADGVRRDPGLTFLNTEALVYGLGDAEKAQKILSWIDGKRTVDGDTVTGKEILSYTSFLNRIYCPMEVRAKYRLAPVSNTVSIEDLSGGGTPWWFSLEGAINVGQGQNAAYGTHLENGGYIFWTVYYELAARAMYQGADDVLRRARDIAKVYRFNSLDSDVKGWAEGLVGEFPENGIVSRAFVTSLAGLCPTADALVIAPALPKGIGTLGIETVRYAGSVFSVRVNADALVLTAAQTPLSGTLRFVPVPSGDYTVELRTAAGSVTETHKTDADGALTMELTGRGILQLTVTTAK